MLHMSQLDPGRFPPKFNAAAHGPQKQPATLQPKLELTPGGAIERAVHEAVSAEQAKPVSYAQPLNDETYKAFKKMMEQGRDLDRTQQRER